MKNTLLGIVVLCALACPAFARIKLITLPVRERVEIQLDNENATLIEEERIVPLVKGENQVDFSWANTQIDQNTIVFRVVAPADGKKNDINVLSVSYPPGEAALVWTVAAGDSGPARVRISYLLGNLTKSFNYRAVAARDEKSLTLSQYVRLQNFANEEFGNTAMFAVFGKEFIRPVGLNETREMLVTKFEKVPVTKTYTASLSEYGWLDQPQNKLRVPMHYVLKNDKKNNLGGSPLPFGKVRIFIEGGDEKVSNTAFLGEDWGKFTPVDDEMKLYLGVAQDIVIKRTVEKNDRTRVAGNLFNQDITLKYEIENFKDQPVTLDIVENVRYVRDQQYSTGRDVEWEVGKNTTLGDKDPTKSTFEKAVFHVQLPARDKDGKAQKQTHKLQLIIKNEW